MAVDFLKLKALGYASVDDLPPGALDGLDSDTLATIAAELPTRKVAVPVIPIDYGKGKLPSRAALVRALQEDDDECGGPGGSLTEAARQLVISARQGNVAAWDRIADRLDGKPSQEVTGTGLAVNVVVFPPAPAAELEQARALYRRMQQDDAGATIEGDAVVVQRVDQIAAHSGTDTARRRDQGA